MYSEDQLLPLSRLSDLVFCERRAALHLIEGLWADNVLTAQGTVMHERAHEPGSESHGAVRTATGLMLRSLRLGLSCKADAVEFHRAESATADNGRPVAVRLPGVAGWWRPYPVEYKRGKAHQDRCYEVQLCAQALCIEEMLGVEVDNGALYSGAAHHRREVAFDAALRAETETAAGRMHELFDRGVTPTAQYSKRCESCSLLDMCLPRQVAGQGATQGYLRRMVHE